MGGGIYLIQDSGSLVELNERPYEAEELLQKLLAEYPNLLAGEQINPGAPRRWLLVSREMGVPDVEGGTGRWSLDHLFLDQDGVPTLIEVKRSTDTRLRREVVGQMLDYAANAVVYWPTEAIRAQFEAHCETHGRDAVLTIAEFIGEEDGPGAFWDSVKRNLQAGRIRMVFVADVIPPELRRIVEFLNGQMDPAEVIAIEIRQFVGQGLKALVPKVVGQTATAQRAKSGATAQDKRLWDEPSFFATLERDFGGEERLVAQDILNWARLRTLRPDWSRPGRNGSFYLMLDHAGMSEYTISVWSHGIIHFEFGHMRKFQRKGSMNPFISDENRRSLVAKFNEVQGINISEDAITRFPKIRLATLVPSEERQHFLSVLDWLVDSIRRGSIDD